MLMDRILPQSEVIRAIVLECSPCCRVPHRSPPAASAASSAAVPFRAAAASRCARSCDRKGARQPNVCTERHAVLTRGGTQRKAQRTQSSRWKLNAAEGILTAEE